MSKPNYRATVTFDPDRKVFLARAPELEHCGGEGASRAEAVAKLEEEIDAQLANMLSHGSTPPRAVDEETFTGEIAAKVSKQLHRDLAYQARSEGIDLDHLVGELLAAAMESRKQTRGVRSGNRQPQEHMPHDNVGNRYDGGGGGGGGRNRGFGGRGHNSALLDDRANFIEYVRGLEQSGGAPTRHGGGGGGGAGGGPGGDRGGRRGRGGRGGRGGNPNHHGGQNRGMQAGGRPMGGAPGNPNGNGGNPSNGNPSNNGHASNESAPASAAPPASPHDPDSSGNA